MNIHEIYECPQCKQSITMPSEITEADQLEITHVCRSGRRIDTMALLMKKFGLGLAESKWMVVHISDPQNQCAKCGNTLLETGITYCPSCSGLNFNW